jgi:probable HAF family extracellular repeat protein
MPETTMRRTTITALALLSLAVSVAGVARPARADIVYTLKDLGTLGGAISQGQGVNDSGQVTRFSGIPTSSTAAHAFLSGPDGGPLKDLGTLGGTSSSATAVNDSGQVVGYSLIARGALHPFLYSGGQMLDLNSLIDPGSGFTLGEANSGGHPTGSGTPSC